MIDIIHAKNRYAKKLEWLKTYWLFSFSDYYDPANMQFGKLRVFNDDVVAPGGGFPAHSHEEMEIITLVMEGEITHEDSMGTKSVISANGVQGMSAGTGLSHSEYNLSDKPLWLYQIWIRPDVEGLKPAYNEKHYDAESFKNRLFPVASGNGVGDAVTIHSDATIYRSELDEGYEVTFKSDPDRKVFLYLTAGSVIVNGRELAQGDQARIESETDLKIKANTLSSFVLIDIG
jgi:quercetin 2,3-dioxygenase